ncbi:phosphate ABC transporter substrate-binding protein [bacterium]|nr:phosphate ABC transporter substrate-binding protein [bacterium]
MLAVLLAAAGCPAPEEETSTPVTAAQDKPAPPAEVDDNVPAPKLVSEEAGEINISGGTAHIPVMEEAQKVFAVMYPNVKISIAGGGSGVGIKQVGEGLVQIGNSGRAPTEEEITTHGLVEFKWAIDGVAAVVHPDNPVSDLTKEQLIKVFAGEITNWSELGGADKGINVYTRDEESGTRKVFVELGLDDGSFVDTANVVVSNGAMKSAIAQDPDGIGYVSVGHIDETVKGLALDGVAPSLENVKSGAFGISRGLYSLTKGEPEGIVKAFLDFLYTDEGKQIITDKGFIPAG